MKNKQLILGIIILLGAVGLFSIASYNKLVTKEAEVDAQWATVESKLQRRADLIPNLVNTVKGSMTHETEVFAAINDASKTLAGADTPVEKATANKELEQSLSRLLVVVQTYPELTSSEAVSVLMDQLEGSENRISVERDRYNNTAKNYNLAIKRFPDSLFASLFGYKSKDFFEADKGAEKVPVVDLE